MQGRFTTMRGHSLGLFIPLLRIVEFQSNLVSLRMC